jgi:transposase
VGVLEAAERLGLSAALRYSWKSKVRLKEGQSETEARLLAENARFKRQMAKQAEELAILKKAAAYFAKGLR